MINKLKYIILFSFMATCSVISKARTKTLELQNDMIHIAWEETSNGWKLSMLKCMDCCATKSVSFGKPDGEYALIYSPTPLNNKRGIDIIEDGDTVKILDVNHSQGTRPMVAQRATSAVVMNRAGESVFFYPEKFQRDLDGITFKMRTKYGKYAASYSLDENFKHDILLTIRFTPAMDGYYSFATPTLGSLSEEELQWGCVPGYFQSDGINSDFMMAYTYAQGLPSYPVLCRENSLTTLCSIISNKNGVTLGVTPLPGQGRNPYPKDHSEHDKVWKIAMSHMNRKSELSPTAYHPVLCEEGSYLKKGEDFVFKVRYTLKADNWYNVYKHFVYDVYKLKESLRLKATEQSLSERLLSLYDYVLDDSVSLWKTVTYNDGFEIGAQKYAGAVKGENNTMKNSDVAAVWMLAKTSKCDKLKNERLPYIRNFKISQQEDKKGFFHGAARGQYYLLKSKEFKEEWGYFYEPIGLTYYTLVDIGNILLFNPKDIELKNVFQAGAERLLKWQKSDGSFEVAYNKYTQEPVYRDLKDLRPTFYGFVVAYKILKDKKYLDAAIKGADWFIENAVKKGHFLGVCGDYRYINDFATGQSSQTLLDLYEITNEQRYLDAAIATAKIYTTSIFTHPIPSEEDRMVKNRKWKDWQLSQVGLSFEHGGSVGSTVLHGPILLASHAGLFVRLYSLTRDPLFIDLARAGVLGRDAFVHPDTRVASYYWTKFDLGPGPFPQHAWWQIGWIVDYLMAEAEMRTEGKVSFPRGFCTPKVGAHQTLGFASGKVFSEEANFIIQKDLAIFDNPNVDYVAAESLDKKKLFVIVLNSQDKVCSVNAQINWSNMNIEYSQIDLEPFGAEIITIDNIFN